MTTAKVGVKAKMTGRKEGKIRGKEEFRADESRVKHQGMIKCNITMAIKQN